MVVRCSWFKGIVVWCRRGQLHNCSRRFNSGIQSFTFVTWELRLHLGLGRGLAERMASRDMYVNLPVLTDKNWSRWSTQMRVLFRGQDVSSVMEEVVSASGKEKEEFKRKDGRALLIIHQCVDDVHFENIQNAASTRETWNILVGCHAGRVKKHLLMEDVDKVSEFFSKMKGCGDIVTDLMVIEKIMWSLPLTFDHIVVALKVQHVKNEEKKTTKKWKGKYDKGKWRKDRNKDEQNERISARRKRNIECFNCHRYGHYASECYAEKEEQKNGQGKEAYIAQVESDSEPIILMTTTSISSHSQDKLWYLDSGCSIHVTCHRDWLVNFAKTERSMVRFADDSTSKVEGVGDVVIRRRNGSCAILTGVLFVLAIRYNLMSIGQIIQKGFTIVMGNFNKVEVFGKKKNLILRSKISKDNKFRISLVKATMCEEYGVTEGKMNSDTQTGGEEGLGHVAMFAGAEPFGQAGALNVAGARPIGQIETLKKSLWKDVMKEEVDPKLVEIPAWKKRKKRVEENALKEVVWGVTEKRDMTNTVRSRHSATPYHSVHPTERDGNRTQTVRLCHSVALSNPSVLVTQVGIRLRDVIGRKQWLDGMARMGSETGATSKC
ncbi:hypothetical protein V8G54_010804 [Vigna mungo]|uniref:CCHC-type domain-containing protein n=1 Tax=Vigna mungo TaxID=3915 RepID=A0AAQ3S578_VIGMU